MLRIAIDASRTTVTQRTGTEQYALQLIRHLLELPSGHEITLYFRDAPPPDLFPEGTLQKIIPFPRAWTHLRFASELWRSRPDVTWVPAHTLPRVFPGRAVVTVHDLGYLHFPEAHPPKERRYLDWSTRYSANRATRIMADSGATKSDLSAFYGIDAEKIHVVYPGVDLQPSGDVGAVRQKYKLPARYLFFLGTLQPRKNIARLVQAFAKWQSESGQNDVILALGGKAGWLYDPAWTQGVENVRLLGFVDDADVPALYSGALGFVFPSLYEGFGFPVLEAMRCGTPVLCANTSSLPELVGEAAILVDPLDVDAICTGIARLVDDDSLRAELIRRGAERVKQFTWQSAAEDALAVLEEA
jgi:glycosyltransferase involved in cell wall biosynthesis